MATFRTLFTRWQSHNPLLRRGLAELDRRRDPLASVLAALAIGCMLLSAYLFRPQLQSLVHYRPTPGPKDFYHPLAPWVFALGALLLVGALSLTRRRVPAPERARQPLDALTPRFAWLLILPGVAALLVLAEINGGLLHVEQWARVSHDTQFGLLAAGVVLVTLGLAGFGWLRRAPDHPFPTAEIAFLTLLTLAALGLRLYHLGSSVRDMVDESHYALGVTYFWAFPDVKLLVPMPTTASFPFLFSYGQAQLTALFGRNLLGLRALSAILGALTVPALYLLARALYDRLTAVIAALVLLTFPPQMQYSRLALNNIADPLFGTLALACFARGLRDRRRVDWVLGGVALGFTQYFYEGGRLLFPALAIGWLGAGVVLWRPRPPLRGLLLAAVAFLIVAAPIYYTLIGQHFPLFNRLEKTEFSDYYWNYQREPDTFATRVAHFKHAALVYVNAPENTTFNYYLYYGGEHPLILEYLVPLFLLGVVIAAWRWWLPGVLPALWLLATTLGNALLVESAVSARYVVVFPALALLIALGLRAALPLLWPPRWPRPLLAGSLIGLALAIALAQGAFYFGPFLSLFNYEVRYHVTYDVEDAMLRSQAFPPGTEVIVLADKVLPQGDAQRLLNFLADGLLVTVKPPDTVTPDLLRSYPRSGDLAFFVPPDDPDLIALLEQVYGPHPLQTSPYDLPEGKALALFYVPADPAAVPQPVG